MAQNGGEVAYKRTNLSSSGAGDGEDRLSALPEDIIICILLRLHTVEAVRTSLLSHFWRRTWTLLPELRFCADPHNLPVLEVLEAHTAPALLRLEVVTEDDSPESVAAWLPLAARRLSGDLMYANFVEMVVVLEEEEMEEEDIIVLPCFEKATRIDLNLGYLALALPSSGIFDRLNELYLSCIRFRGTCELGDIVSSPRCPCLRKLRVEGASGVTRLTVHSKSLLEMGLWDLNELQRLNIDAPGLNELSLQNCFTIDQKPLANISAPQLISLLWRDLYDPCYVQLGNSGRLQRLSTNYIFVYKDVDYSDYNHEILLLLQHFQVIHSLNIGLCYPVYVNDLLYLMEDITHLPHITFLTMDVMNEGHVIGAGLFHMLRMCTGIRRLSLYLHSSPGLEAHTAQSTCPSGCICDQPTDWKIEKLSLTSLKEVEITGLKGAGHEVAFLEQLFNWAVVLEKLKITFDCCVSKSEAKELCQRLLTISRPETLKEFRMYRDSQSGPEMVELLLLEDEGGTEV